MSHSFIILNIFPGHTPDLKLFHLIFESFTIRTYIQLSSDRLHPDVNMIILSFRINVLTKKSNDLLCNSKQLGLDVQK